MKQFHFPVWTLPIALLLITIAGFGILIPWLGFYWDDWPSIWFLHLFGPIGFIDVLASDRPFLGAIFVLTTTFLRESVQGWQIFGLLSRWVTGVTFWWTLRLLWPQKSRQTAWIAILFTIYPGFSQQSISVTYSHAWVILAVFIASLGTMLAAIRSPKWYWLWTGLSLACSAFAMFSTEYFFTLELLRPILCWIVISEQTPQWRQRIKRVFLYWLPYLILMGVFITWRFYLHEFPRGELLEPARLLSDPSTASVQLGRTILEDIFEGGILAWYLPVSHFLTFNLQATSFLASLLVAAVVAVLAVVYLVFYEPPSHEKNEPCLTKQRSWALQAIVVGMSALLVSGWPFWLTDLLIKLEFPNDRFLLSMMIGSSLLLVGLLELIPKAIYLKTVVLGLLIGLAAGQQFNYANTFRLDWLAQVDFFSQLTWRAPAIKPGTTIMVSRLPFRYFADNSLSAPLNWIYAPENKSRQMPYLVYDIQSRRGNHPKKIEQGETIHQPYRATSFTGSTSQALVLTYSPPACLKILDPLPDENNPTIPNATEKALHLSDIDNILLDEGTATLPQHIFGRHPLDSWCYYYQKAELARQQGDWPVVAELGNQALLLDELLYPVNAPELMTYIEGYAHTGQWKRAVELSDTANQLASNIRPMLCDTWYRLQNNTLPEENRDKALETTLSKFQCPKP